MNNKIKQSAKVLHDGGIIAYPTEGVFGLGCDPFNETAVLRLLKIKKRSVKKGLILIASSWDQVRYLIKTKVPNKNTIQADKKPVTLVFPATSKTPLWITGKFGSIAVRITSHQVAKKLCKKFGGAIVSTSANFAKKPPIKNIKQVYKQLGHVVDLIVPGRLGSLKKPTEIRDALTWKILRK